MNKQTKTHQSNNPSLARLEGLTQLPFTFNGYIIPERLYPHDKTNHPDEIFASVLAQKAIYKATGIIVPIQRLHFSKVTKAILNSPKFWVIDQCGVYDPNIGCFDHHHDGELDASNMLVKKHLVDMGLISEGFSKFLDVELFDYLNKVDTGKIIEGVHHSLPTINKAIRTIGWMDMFEHTWDFIIELADTLLEGLWSKWEAMSRDEKTWNTMITKEGRIAYDKRKGQITNCPNWTKFAKADGVDFFIWHNKKYASWSLMTIDSRIMPIENLRKTGGQTYVRLGSPYIASYDTFDNALNHARSMVKRYKTGAIVAFAPIHKLVKSETIFVIRDDKPRKLTYMVEMYGMYYFYNMNGVVEVLDGEGVAFWTEKAAIKFIELNNY